jgi:hypothetical protein
MDRDKMSYLYKGPSKGCSFRPDPLTSMPPQAILVSDWLISKIKFSSETVFSNELKFGR